MKRENIVVMFGWVLLLTSCALPSWRILPEVNLPGAKIFKEVFAAGDWKGFMCAYVYYPCWVPNALMAFAPLALLIRKSRAVSITAIMAWISFLASSVFTILERTGHGFYFQGDVEARLLIGCYLWLSAYVIIAVGLTLRALISHGLVEASKR